MHTDIVADENFPCSGTLGKRISIHHKMLALFAIWLLLTGLDDLFVNLAYLYRWFVMRCLGRRRIRAPTEADLAAVPFKRIAVFVPLWREHGVIRSMIEHNLAALRYDHCDFFIGVYPNDGPTLAVVRELAARFPTVHLSECPHPGPTSKADNLNWVFQRMLLFESERQVRFDIVVTHDAEDMMHPESLRWINYYAQWYDMTQIPVLPLPTPSRELLHGVYCDEFADYQSKELQVRQFLGGFLPSCGTGAGFSRVALDRLGTAYASRLFEPTCLTEDYEHGFRLHRLGCPQILVPITRWNGAVVATRAYFPRRFRSAVKQRTRWVMGIALQSWELNGWRETLGQLYWFWRDRKGLVGCLVGPVAHLVFLYGVADWCAHGASGNAAHLILSANPIWIINVFAFSLGLQVMNMGMRIRFTARIYGWKFASVAPARAFLGNLINSAATACAIYRYSRAKWNRQPLGWLKTDHAYPNRAALIADRRPLGELLVGSQYLAAAELTAALASQPPGMRIGEYLVHSGKLTERELYECLSLQQNLDFQILDRTQISSRITRALPAKVSRKWKVLGYKVVSGQLFVAGPNALSDEMHADLRRFCSLEIHFHLITPENFESLQREFLPVRK
jgi:bacteriophage N4 adsorption protein B